MKYLNRFNEALSNKEEILGNLLHLYGSIPLTKEKSSIIIGKILKSSGLDFELGENINMIGSQFKKHDKVRFMDYFDSLIKGKDTRGDNFEGLLAGFYDGELKPRGHKYDVIIDGKNWSVKFLDSPGKQPQIGSYKNALALDDDFTEDIKRWGGISRMFQIFPNKDPDKGMGAVEYRHLYTLKADVWDIISKDVDGWLIAYPNKTTNPTTIEINMISKEIMEDIILEEGLTGSPKGGYNKLFDLSMSATYKNHVGVDNFHINLPNLDVRQLQSMDTQDDEIKWAREVFGQYGSKIRPDVLRHIRLNKQRIITKLQNMKEK